MECSTPAAGVSPLVQLEPLSWNRSGPPTFVNVRKLPAFMKRPWPITAAEIPRLIGYGGHPRIQRSIDPFLGCLLGPNLAAAACRREAINVISVVALSI